MGTEPDPKDEGKSSSGADVETETSVTSSTISATSTTTVSDGAAQKRDNGRDASGGRQQRNGDGSPPPTPAVATNGPEDWEKVAPKPLELFCGLLAILVWISAFVVGYVIPTASLRESILATGQAWGQVSPQSADPTGQLPPPGSSPTTPKAGDATTAGGVAAPAATPTPSTAPAPGVAPSQPPAQASGGADGSEKKPKFRDNLNWLTVIGYTILVGVAFTLSNIWFLCLSAAFLGCMGRRWSTPFDYDPAEEQSSSEYKPDEPKRDEHNRADIREVRRAYTTAVLRGFLVYLSTLAGYLIVLPESAVTQLGPGQYARLAGAVSALAFVVGWRPESIIRLLTSVFGAPRELAVAPARGGGGAARAGRAVETDADADLPPEQFVRELHTTLKRGQIYRAQRARKRDRRADKRPVAGGSTDLPPPLEARAGSPPSSSSKPSAPPGDSGQGAGIPDKSSGSRPESSGSTST